LRPVDLPDQRRLTFNQGVHDLGSGVDGDVVKHAHEFGDDSIDIWSTHMASMWFGSTSPPT